MRYTFSFNLKGQTTQYENRLKNLLPIINRNKLNFSAVNISYSFMEKQGNREIRT